jgi:type II secretory pathway component GspD/PulD (secretin)
MFVFLAFTVTFFARSAGAQTPAVPADTETYQTLYLTSLTKQSDANDIQTDLRNMFPKSKLYLVGSQNAISMRGTHEDIQLAQKMLSDIDKTRKTYRLTYAITEMENGKPTGTQHYALVVAAGSKTTLKQGSKVPFVTGGGPNDGTPAQNSQSQSQVQYIDIGLNIDASVDGYADGLRLRTKVEQSSVAPERSGIGTQDPLIRQATLEGTSTLVEGKPVVIGSLEIPGSARRQEIEVVAQSIR